MHWNRTLADSPSARDAKALMSRAIYCRTTSLLECSSCSTLLCGQNHPEKARMRLKKTAKHTSPLWVCCSLPLHGFIRGEINRPKSTLRLEISISNRFFKWGLTKTSYSDFWAERLYYTERSAGDWSRGGRAVCDASHSCFSRLVTDPIPRSNFAPCKPQKKYSV